MAQFVSAIRRRIIERVVFTEYQFDCLDLYLVELGPRIVNRRNRTLIPIVRERDATATPLNNNFESRAYGIWLANGDRSGIYMELQPHLNAARASLSDPPELLRELRGPEPAP